MPTWVSLYFAAYVTYSLWAHISDFRPGKINLWAILEIVGNMCLLLPALAYWYPQLHSFFREVMSAFFALGVVSVAVFAYRGFRKNYPDHELSLPENIGLSVFSTIFLISLTSPLIWWGSQSLLK